MEDAVGEDDPSIAPEEFLLRRISARWMVPDGAGGRRVSSQAFQDLVADDGTKAMSAYLESRLHELGLDQQDTLSGFLGYGLIAFSVGAARTCGLGVVRRPLTTDGARGEAHVHVLGKKSSSRQNALIKACNVRVVPTPLSAGGDV